MSDKLAREGEPVFAVIIRNRSGQFAGEIDYRLADLRALPLDTNRQIVDNIYALYEAACKATGLVAKFTEEGHVVHRPIESLRWSSTAPNESNKPKPIE